MAFFGNIKILGGFVDSGAKVNLDSFDVWDLVVDLEVVEVAAPLARVRAMIKTSRL